MSWTTDGRSLTLNSSTARQLCELNNRFYLEHAESFSSSRQSPWPGWQRCLGQIDDDLLAGNNEFRVLDLACGNLRFESFLRSEYPELKLAYYAVDNCDVLIPNEASVNYQHLDILEVLLQGYDLNDHLEVPECSLTVSFGFMHHTPLQGYREKVLDYLIEKTEPGGSIVVTFWQFMKDESLRSKALDVHKRALRELGLGELAENDFLLDWNNIAGVYRYCHSFSDEEIYELLEKVVQKTELIDRFVSDGRSHSLNTYVVLKKL